MNKKICGIDEAGRGPLAGPLCVAGVIFKKDIANNKQFTFLNDSKKLTEKKRELLFPLIKENSHYHIVLKSNHEIDKFGISYCLKTAIMEIMNNIPKDEGINFLIDGNTSFGIENLNHLIKADTLIKEVSAASILAKVTRDRFMMEISKDYPLYEFTKHKGYGTALHVEKIKLFGKSNLHRLTFKLKGIDS